MGAPCQAVQWVFLDGADVPPGALWVLGQGYLSMLWAGQGQEAAGAWRDFSHPLAGIFYPGSQAEISLQTGTKAASLSPSLSPHQAAGWHRGGHSCEQCEVVLDMGS